MDRTSQSDDIELREYLRVIRRGAWLIVLVAVVFVGAALLRASQQTKVYAADAEVRVFNPRASTVLGGDASRVTPEREVDTQALYAKSAKIRAAVEERLGPRAGAVGDLQVSSVAATDVIRLKVESRVPEVARDAALAFAEVFVEDRQAAVAGRLRSRAEELRGQAAELQAQVAAIDAEITERTPPPRFDAAGRQIPAVETEQVRNLRSQRQVLTDRIEDSQETADRLEIETTVRQADFEIVDAPALPRNPVRPTPLRDAAIALGAALAIGVGIVLARDRLADRIHSVADVRTAAPGVSVLATIPPVARRYRRRRRRKRPGRPLSISDPGSQVAEAYRALRATVLFMPSEKGQAQWLLVTSATPRAGKSTAAAELSVSLAQAGWRVVLVDGDVRQPSQHQIFGTSNTEGLTAVIEESQPLPGALQRVPTGGEGTLDLLVAGPPAKRPADLLLLRRTADLFYRISEAAEFVVIDSPPVLATADPLALSQLAQGVVVTVLVGITRRAELEQAIRRLEQVSAPLLGVILIGARDVDSTRYYEAYAQVAASVPRHDGGRSKAAARAQAKRASGTSGH